MKKSARIICMAALLMTAACDGAIDGIPNFIKSPSHDPGDALALNGAVIACETGEDCSVVQLGCCDHCNGGFAVAVNREFASEVAERNRESCYGDEICTEMACPEIYPRCLEGECVYADEVSFDWQTCDSDRDCAIVQLGCCDHCNGGRVVAANAAYAEQVKEEMSDVCGEDYACTLMACAPQLAKCEQGLCAAYPDPDWGIH